MKALRRKSPTGKQLVEADRLADFVLFTQRSCILNLSGKLNKDKVSFPQFFLLTHLVVTKNLTMSDIAQKMGHSTAAATGLIDKLEERGYVERQLSESDRRKTVVNITPKGKRLVTAIRKKIASSLAELMTLPEEQSSFSSLH